MNEQLRLLIELQKLDTVILALHSRIDTLPGTIAASEGPLKKTEASLENIKQGHAVMEKKKKDRELDIEEISAKIEKMKHRTSEIKNNKEYQAHLKEVEKAERDLKAAEDELLNAIESIEKTSKLLAAEQNLMNEERSKLDVVKKEIAETVGVCKQEVKKLKHERKKFTEKLEADIYKLYINLMRSKRGFAVVEAKNERCGGCNLNIPPQMFVELKQNSEIIHCPQCERILYYSNSEAVTETDPEN